MPTVWLATAEGLVSLDLVAVELAVNGLRKGWTLTSHEAAYAAAYLFPRGVEYSVIANRVGVSGATLRRWFPADDTPLGEAMARIRTRQEALKVAVAKTVRPRVRCGTYQGARAHRRRKEPLDEACREALRVADRHYREHGTYIGAPEIAS
ncbi:hypothetical protein [Streptomyces sp. NPDC047000]|uniref:hypothetical protein n=1 Tax=Streptomyces sp. NPDC047000 TaxID=3155474 RepID=UPI003409A367